MIELGLAILLLVMASLTGVHAFLALGRWLKEDSDMKLKETLAPVGWFLFFSALYLWFFTPGVVSFWWYQVIFPHIPTGALILLGLFPIVLGVLQLRKNLVSATGWVYVLASVVIALATPHLLEVGTQVALQEENPPSVLERVIPANLERFQFTPPEVAKALLKNSYGESGGHVDQAHVDNTILDGSNAYVAPVLPDGLFQTLKPSPGFEILFDKEQATTELFLEEFRNVPGLFFLNDVNRKLAQFRHSTVFDDINYIFLSTNGRKELVGVVPEWGWNYSWFRAIPVWKGATLIYPSGKLVHLDPDKIVKDPQFRGMPMYPTKLVTSRAKALNYGRGDTFFEKAFNGETKSPGQYVIEETLSEPIFFSAESGDSYYVYLLSPRGRANGTSGVFYVDTATGQGYLVSFRGQNLLSVKAASEAASNVAGFGQGYRNVAPRILTRPGSDPQQDDLVLVFSRVPDSGQSIARTVVIEPRKAVPEPIAFRNRQELITWLRGGQSPTDSDDKFAELQQQLERALDLVRQARQQGQDPLI